MWSTGYFLNIASMKAFQLTNSASIIHCLSFLEGTQYNNFMDINRLYNVKLY